MGYMRIYRQEEGTALWATQLIVDDEMIAEANETLHDEENTDYIITMEDIRELFNSEAGIEPKSEQIPLRGEGRFAYSVGDWIRDYFQELLNDEDAELINSEINETVYETEF